MFVLIVGLLVMASVCVSAAEEQQVEDAINIATDDINVDDSGCSHSSGNVKDSPLVIRDDEKEEEMIFTDPVQREEDVDGLSRRPILREMIIKRLLRSARENCGKGVGGCFRPDHCARMCAIHCRRMDRNKRTSTCMATNKNQCLHVSPK